MKERNVIGRMTKIKKPYFQCSNIQESIIQWLIALFYLKERQMKLIFITGKRFKQNMMNSMKNRSLNKDKKKNILI